MRRVLVDAAESMGVHLLDAWNRRAAILAETEGEVWDDFFPGFVRSFLDLSAEWSAKQQKEQFRAGFSSTEKRWICTEVLVVLLACLPNLRRLGLESPREFVTRGSHRSAFEAVGVTRLPLRRYDYRGHSLAVMSLAGGLEELNVVDGTVKPDLRLPRLTTLRISEGFFSEWNLESLLEACTGGLRTFAYEAKSQPRSRYAPQVHHQPSFAVRLLRNHRSSLRHIHYDVGLQTDTVALEQDATFADFPVLDNLLISSDLVHSGPATEVPDADALTRLLPPSLRRLCIRGDCFEDVKAALFGLAARMKRDPGAFAKLEVVTAEVQRGEEEELEGVFGLVGVEFGTECCSLRDAREFCIEMPRLGGLVLVGKT